MIRPPPRSPPFPTRRSSDLPAVNGSEVDRDGSGGVPRAVVVRGSVVLRPRPSREPHPELDGLAHQRHHLGGGRSEEHTSELQSCRDLVCRLLLEKKKKKNTE